MSPSCLMADVPCAPGSRREAELHYRILLRYLADHVYTATLANGAGVRDALDFRQWLEECAAAIAPGARPSASVSLDCPRCGHTHQNAKDCGQEIRPGEFCGCVYEMRVTA